MARAPGCSVIDVENAGCRTPNKRRSLRALDFVNFFQADIQTGVGPFLAVYLLATRHWDPGRIGIAMSVQGIATIVGQTPAGALIDRTPLKRTLIVLASLIIGGGSIAMVHAHGLAPVIAVQVLIGLTAVVVPVAIAAITRGLVGNDDFAPRMGRNEAFNHAGNVSGALMAGVLGQWFAQSAIFYFAAAMALATAIATFGIRGRDIDHRMAREAAANGAENQPASARALLADYRIATFAGCVIMFHFANAAMLPLLGELLARHAPRDSSAYMSACIIVAQLVMAPVALLAGRLAATVGRKRTLLIGFGVLPLRAALYTSTNVPFLLVAVQILDGIGAGIFGVVWVIVVADLARGTGRFNLLQGAIMTGVSVGASLSNLMTGFVVRHSGYNAGFFLLGAIALGAFLMLLFAMPETLERAALEPLSAAT